MTPSYRVARALLIGALPLLVACAAQQTPKTARAPEHDEPLPALTVPALTEPIDQRFAFFEAAVYTAMAPAGDVRALVESLRATHYPELHVLDGDPDPTKLPAVYVRSVPATEMPPPSLDDLEYFGKGLSPEQAKDAAASQHLVSLFFVDESQRARANLLKQNALVLSVAEQLGGYPWDGHTRQLFARDAWKRRVDAPGVSVLDHVNMHMYRDGSLIRIVTLGMNKLGLPDVEVNQVAAGDAQSTATLVNLLCTRLIEGARPRADGSMVVALDEVHDTRLVESISLLDGATKRADLLVRRTKGQQGDTSEELLELFFGDADDRHVHERRHLAIDAMFGSTDSMVQVDHGEELLAASARAREKLKDVKLAFERGLAPGERLLVKAPFKTDDGGNEWMWVEVVRWQGETIDGVLMNDPELVSGLVSGASVRVQQEDLFDYILVHADGTSEGNETGEILERSAR